jgi:hypothetical protein
MMSNIGTQQVQEMQQRIKNQLNKNDTMDQLNINQKSRFIISPYNYWYLQWNNSI